MANIFGGFSCICSAGYLELRGVPQFMWSTSNCAGYLKSRRVPRIVWEFSPFFVFFSFFQFRPAFYFAVSSFGSQWLQPWQPASVRWLQLPLPPALVWFSVAASSFFIISFFLFTNKINWLISFVLE